MLIDKYQQEMYYLFVDFNKKTTKYYKDGLI